MGLNEMRARYEREEGYSRLNATARVCQDVILSKLAASSIITFHAYDDASSTFPTSDCREPLIIVDGSETGFAEILDKLDAGTEPDAQDRSLIDRIVAEEPDCMMYESHVRKGRCNFLFFEKGFEKLSLREVRLRLEHRDEEAGKRKVNRNVIECAWGCDYSPIQESYGRCLHCQDRYGRRVP